MTHEALEGSAVSQRPVRPLDVFHGNVLAPDEVSLWRGRPLYRRVAFDILHARGIALYFVGLLALDAYQIWAKRIPLAPAIHNSVPLVIIIGLAGGLLLAAAWLIMLTTHYEVTNHRVILKYGMALPATLSLPYSQIVEAAVAVNPDHSGDIALVLKDGNHMAYFKLWPLARAWHLSHPEPMLRGIPRAGFIGSMLARAIVAARPVVTKPVATKPVATKPSTTKPVAIGPTPLPRAEPAQSAKELLNA